MCNRTIHGVEICIVLDLVIETFCSILLLRTLAEDCFRGMNFVLQ